MFGQCLLSELLGTMRYTEIRVLWGQTLPLMVKSQLTRNIHTLTSDHQPTALTLDPPRINHLSADINQTSETGQQGDELVPDGECDVFRLVVCSSLGLFCASVYNADDFIRYLIPTNDASKIISPGRCNHPWIQLCDTVPRLLREWRLQMRSLSHCRMIRRHHRNWSSSFSLLKTCWVKSTTYWILTSH